MPGIDSSTSRSGAARVEFAHRLRGIAALSVVADHYLGVFWKGHAETMTLMFLPPLTRLPLLDPVHEVLAALGTIFGMFGVGIFFVLSGFVITLAILRETPQAFLMRRVFRIYPVYMIGFLLTIGAIYVSTLMAGTEFKYSLAHIFTHTLIVVRAFIGFLRIDGISWTLEVELYFYVAMALWGRGIIEGGAKAVQLAAMRVALGSLPFIVFKINGFVGLQLSCGLLLLSGVAFAMHYIGRLRDRELLQLQAVLLALFSAVWVVIALRLKISVEWFAGFVLGASAFALGYRFWRSDCPHSRIADLLADISYPLYVTHGLFGYIVMYWVVARTGSAYLAIVAAFAAAVVIAYALHRFVELPAMRWARRIEPAPAALRSKAA